MADAAATVVAPAMPAECLLDRSAVIMGCSGVYSSFLKRAQRYGVLAHQLLHCAGQRKLIGGQQDQLIEIALEITRKLGHTSPRATGKRRSGQTRPFYEKKIVLRKKFGPP